MLPISLLVVPVIPRRLVRDNSGNLIPYFDSVGYWGMISEVFGFVPPVSAIWTLSAGLVGLMSYLRSRGEINIDSQPDEDL